MTKRNLIKIAVGVSIVSSIILGILVLNPSNKVSPDSSEFQNETITNIPRTDSLPDLSFSSNPKRQNPQIYSSKNQIGYIGSFENKPIDNPIDNIFHVKIDQKLIGNETIWLEYELYGVEDYTGISHSINDQLSIGGYFIKKNKQWNKQREQLNPKDVKKGDNVIRFTLPESADYGYQVRNLFIHVEPFNENVAFNPKPERRLIVNQPTTEYYYGNLGYLQGYVIGDENYNAQVFIDGEKIRYNQGTFESLVEKNTDEDNWTITVQVVFEDGQLLNVEVPFNKPSEWHEQNGFDKNTHYAEQLVTNQKGFDIQLANVHLKGDPESVENETNISITALRDIDIPALDAGMVNVTAGYAGYRFLPHGTQFKKGISVELGYDTTKIPDGYGEKDILTYFFDEGSHHWVALPRDSVLLASNITKSYTNHFSDYINAIIKVPESPETQGYTPTSIKDVKAANPAAGINLIQPPTANSMGNANLSYPINIPSGRQGMQPQLAISYNSGGGNGWLGLGWDLSVPSISVDTRWGVPHYDTFLESETYLMSGEQLSPVAHREEWVTRTSERQFYPRIEGSFSIIIRHGDNPKNYWWEATDKSGVKYFYGGNENSVDNNAVLKDYEDNIAYWALTRVVDVLGNTVNYEYVIDEIKKSATDEYPSRQIFLTRINYTGFGQEEGAYSIDFKRTTKVNGNERIDQSFDARLAFKRHVKDLLKTIEVKFKSEIIRSYELDYATGEFHKTLLVSITEFDSQGNFFNKHDFEYYDDIKDLNSGNFFTNEETWTSGGDGISVDLGINDLEKFKPTASALSGSSSWNAGGGLYVGPGFGVNPSSKIGTAGGSYSYSHSESDGRTILIDINGDGLADKLIQSGGKVWFKPQLSGTSNEGMRFGDRVDILTISKFLKEKSNSHSLGAQINPANKVCIGMNTTYSKSKTTVYFSDVNSDGLPDLIDNGKVYFNRLVNGIPTFDKSSGETLNPINEEGSIDSDIFTPDPNELKEAEDQSPLHDVVRVWQAPYTGYIDIHAPISLLKENQQERSDYGAADGIIASLELNGERLEYVIIAESDYTIQPIGVKNQYITKGNKVFFRIHSRYDGAYDQVKWNPEITYVDKDTTQRDENNKHLYKFNASEDFLLVGEQNINAPIDGKVIFEPHFAKDTTSDNVNLYIIKLSSKDNDESNVIWSSTLPWDSLATINVPKDIEVKKGDNFKFLVETNSNIDWTAISCKPRMYYVESHDTTMKSVFSLEGDTLIDAYMVPEYTLFTNNIHVDSAYVIQDSSDFVVFPQLEIEGYSGHVFMTLKKRNKLIGNKTLFFNDGVLDKPDSIAFVANKGDSLFLIYTLPENKNESNFISKKYTIQNSTKTINDTLEATVYTTISMDDNNFGNLYRGWGQFVYNANDGRGDEVIKQVLLHPDDNLANASESDYDNIDDPNQLQGANIYNPSKSIFIIMAPDARKNSWVAYDEGTYLSKEIQSSSRMGEDALTLINPLSGGSSARAVDKTNRSFNLSLSGSAGVSGSATTGWNRVLTDFTDMNGDRYPDIVTNDKIQFTSADGSLSELKKSFDALHKTNLYAEGVSFRGKFTETYKEQSWSTKGNAYVIKTHGSTFSLGGGTGHNYTSQTFVDVNGDGLPDKLKRNGKVSINLGYEFADEETWRYDSLGGGTSYDINGGTGFSFLNNSFEGGIGLSTSFSHISSSFIDVNGDGLVDLVTKNGTDLYLSLNLGTDFAEPKLWAEIDDIEKSSTTSASTNVSFTFGFTTLFAKVVFTPSISAGIGMSRTNTIISDINGDGFPDFLKSEIDSDIKVKASVIGRTNMLKKVTRPLGAYFTLDYKPVGNTYDMPQSVWALSTVEINDGHTGDGDDTQKNTFVYTDGYHDRYERTFYGFGEVRFNQYNGSNIYRSVVREYSTEEYYSKGLLLTETLMDNSGKKYTATENEFELKTVSGAPVDVKFPAIISSKKFFYEGGKGEKSTTETFVYDDYGNVTTYTDLGDTGNEDDLIAEIAYHNVKNKNIVSVPSSIKVKDNGGEVRSRSTSIDQSTGKVTKITLDTGNGNAVYDFSHDNYGNLLEVIRPANHKGERMSYGYTYDSEVNIYVTEVKDAYGFSSSTSYDYKFGQIKSTTDINGQQTKYELDEQGRIESITGPYEIASGSYTLRFKYFPNSEIPWAQTQHFDPDNPGNPIETAIFIDGLGRIIQTKKDGALFSGKEAQDNEVMIVSGKVEYDALGRSVMVYYPISENKGNTGIFNTNTSKVAPTKFSYEVLDRTILTTLPNGAITETSYGFGSDRDGNTQFMTIITDAKGLKTESFTDIKGRQTAVKAPGDTWTSFDYNAIGDLLQVTDPEGNVTTSVYDKLGRRVSRNHPDAGITSYAYDAMGNIISKTDANGDEVSYDYEYSRLIGITYPKNTYNNVTFEYGGPMALNNCVGRITIQEDASGAQEFKYGLLGEVVENIRTVIVPDEGIYTFKTQWEYDTWNRLKKMVYPDGEEVSYKYNEGGLLNRMYGTKNGSRYNYVTQIGYDEFEDRVYLSYGNGTETTYDYEPDRRRLQHISATTASGRKMMDNTYSYDNVNNITQIKSTAPIPGVEFLGGNFEYNYSYDDLYRLKGADGIFRGSTTQHEYDLAMQYSPTGRILHKSQEHRSKAYDETTWGKQQKTTYNLTYEYHGEKPHAPSQIGDDTYTYDANGNQTSWQSTVNNQRRDILWDEENRMRALADNGQTHHYIYDASGERVIKATGDGQAIYINGFPMGGSGTVGSYTMYVNPFMVVSNSKYTKHFYIEGQRIVSKIGEAGSYKQMLSETDNSMLSSEINWDLKGQELKEAIFANFEELGLDGAVFTSGKSGKTPYGQLKKYYRTTDGGNGGGNSNDTTGTSSNKNENFQYFYHSDHLGSSSYISDASGEVHQHMEYFPFGETFFEEAHGNDKNTPYKFNGKELDEETGLYYYGARYYDPRISMWYGVDPLSDKFPGWSSYNFTFNNPIVLTDPDGREPRWGQLGNLSQINFEITSAAGNGTYNQQMAQLRTHFSGNRLFTRVNGKLQDAPGSVNVKRYLYTEKAGWIDMEHFFAFATYANDNGIMAASLLAYGTEEAQGTKLPGWNRTASAYSYEDIQSDFAGIDFWLKYGESIENGDIELTVAVDQYLQSLNPTDPSKAPNIEYIPHVVNGEFTPRNMGDGWTGNKLKSEHKKVYDTRSEDDKKRIQDAHNTINN